MFLLFIFCAPPASARKDGNIEQKIASIKNNYSFVVMGDSQGGDETYSGLLKRAVGYKPDLIIHLGDMVRSPGSLSEWSRFRRLSHAGGIPQLLVAGNHDVGDGKSEQMYKEQAGMPGNGLFYSLVAGKTMFIILDTCIAGEEYRIAGRQYKWLEKVLSDSAKYRFRFVFLHHPLYPEKGRGIHFGESLDAYPNDRDRLQALFVRHKVNVVFAAHEHLYLRKKIDGVYNIISGGGGAGLYASEKKGGFFHFILARIDDNTASFKVIDKNGTIRDSFSMQSR